MSISLKVVSIAAAFCAAFSRSAIALPQPRHPHPHLALASRGQRRARSGGVATGKAGAGSGAGAGRASAAATSALVSRPPGPARRNPGGVEATFGDQLAHRGAGAFERSGSGSALTRLAALGTLSRNAGEGGPGRRRLVGVRARRGGRAFGDPARSPRRPRRLAPSSAKISASVPAAGADTSNVTLSVSSSTTGSSTRDRVARLLQPFRDRRLGHRFAEARHFDLGSPSGHRLRPRALRRPAAPAPRHGA